MLVGGRVLGVAAQPNHEAERPVRIEHRVQRHRVQEARAVLAIVAQAHAALDAVTNRTHQRRHRLRLRVRPLQHARVAAERL